MAGSSSAMEPLAAVQCIEKLLVDNIHIDTITTGKDSCFELLCLWFCMTSTEHFEPKDV